MRLDWERAADLQAKGLSQRLKGLSRSSGADWQRAGIPGETVVDMIVKGGLVVDQKLCRAQFVGVLGKMPDGFGSRKK